MKWKNASEDIAAALSVGSPVYVVTTDYFFSHYWDPQTLEAWGNMRLRDAERIGGYVSEMSRNLEPVHVIQPRQARAIGPTVTIARLYP